MSNETTASEEEDWIETQKFFLKHNDPLSHFAETHNLKIDKYWHNFPSWRFSFKHPLGGVACIELFSKGPGKVRVNGYWWIDDYEEGIRYSRRHKSDVLQENEADMSDLLEETLKMIVSWPLNSWTDVGGGFQTSWHKHFTKVEFIGLDEEYPTPNLLK